MNPLRSLILQSHPLGISFRPLGSFVLKNKGGGTPSRKNPKYWDGDIPWASVGDITASTVSITNTRQAISPTGLENSSSNVIPSGWVIATVKIAPGEIRVVETPMAINQDLRGLKLHSSLNPRFLSYFFKTIHIPTTGTIVQGITSAALLRIKVPVLSLEVQERIVGVLDSFVKLEAELEAELKARKMQYKFYRDSMLTFSAIAERERERERERES